MSLPWSEACEADATHVGSDRFAVADGSDEADGSGARAIAAVLAAVDPFDPQGSLQRALRSSNWELWYRGGATPDSRGVATVTIAVWSGYRFTVGHVGDSRAYLVRGGRAHQLSSDHASPLTPEPTGAEPTGGQLGGPGGLGGLDGLGGLGGDSDVGVVRIGQRPGGWAPEVVSVAPEPGDRLLLCTDGMWRCASDAELATAVGGVDPASACRSLETHALFRASEAASAVVVAVEPGVAGDARRDGARGGGR